MQEQFNPHDYSGRLLAQERRFSQPKVYEILVCWLEHDYGLANVLNALDPTATPEDREDPVEWLGFYERRYSKEAVYLALLGFVASNYHFGEWLAELEHNGPNY